MFAGGDLPDLGELGEASDDFAAALAKGENPEDVYEPPCNSFAPDTPVLMGDGKTEPIGDLKPGDKVQAADPDTGKHKGSRTVTATHIHHDDDLLDLTIETSPATPQSSTAQTTTPSGTTPPTSGYSLSTSSPATPSKPPTTPTPTSSPFTRSPARLTCTTSPSTNSTRTM
jgi:hypothetical protein